MPNPSYNYSKSYKDLSKYMEITFLLWQSGQATYCHHHHHHRLPHNNNNAKFNNNLCFLCLLFVASLPDLSTPCCLLYMHAALHAPTK